MSRILDDGLQALALRGSDAGRAPFKYTQLDVPESSLRLLTLHFGKSGEPIRCIINSYYTEAETPAYQAISYTWGPAGDERIIELSGKTLWVRKNLYSLLENARQAACSLPLWVDAICIDQTCIPERNIMVKKMGKIYGGAEKVLVWIGDSNENSDMAMEYISKLDPQKYVDEHSKVSQTPDLWPSKSYLFDNLEELMENEPLANSLVNLFLRPWYNRVWIQQEAAPCKETMVLCGQKLVSWDNIFAIAWLLLPRESIIWPNFVKADLRDIEPKLLAARAIQTSRRRAEQKRTQSSYVTTNPFRVLIIDCWACLSEDPRDKMYALRGLAGDPEIDQVCPAPDYDAAWEDVYLDVAERMLRDSRLNFLSCAGRAHQPADTLLPSWVPDWRQRSIHRFIVQNEWRAGSLQQTQSKLTIIPKGHRRKTPKLPTDSNQTLPKKVFQYAISMNCIMQDNIAFLGGIAEGWQKSSDLPKASQNLINAERACSDFTTANLAPTYLTTETLESAYAATLLAGTDHKDRLAGSEWCLANYTAWRAWLTSGVKGAPPAYHEALESSEAFWETLFCVTAHGYLCLVPKMTASSDTIAILKGHVMPVVLRAKEHGYYELLGDCYVHGMMNGEAFYLINEHGLKHGKGLGANKKGKVEEEEGMDGYTGVYTTLGVRTVNLV